MHSDFDGLTTAAGIARFTFRKRLTPPRASWPCRIVVPELQDPCDDLQSGGRRGDERNDRAREPLARPVDRSAATPGHESVRRGRPRVHGPASRRAGPGGPRRGRGRRFPAVVGRCVVADRARQRLRGADHRAVDPLPADGQLAGDRRGPTREAVLVGSREELVQRYPELAATPGALARELLGRRSAGGGRRVYRRPRALLRGWPHVRGAEGRLPARGRGAVRTGAAPRGPRRARAPIDGTPAGAGGSVADPRRREPRRRIRPERHGPRGAGPRGRFVLDRPRLARRRVAGGRGDPRSGSRSAEAPARGGRQASHAARGGPLGKGVRHRERGADRLGGAATRWRSGPRLRSPSRSRRFASTACSRSRSRRAGGRWARSPPRATARTTRSPTTIARCWRTWRIAPRWRSRTRGCTRSSDRRARAPRTPTSTRTNSSRCWATSCATRWRRSGPRWRSCASFRGEDDRQIWAREAIARQVAQLVAAGRRPAGRLAHQPRARSTCVSNRSISARWPCRRWRPADRS